MLSDEGSNWSSGLENTAESAGGDQLALSTSEGKDIDSENEAGACRRNWCHYLFFSKVAAFSYLLTCVYGSIPIKESYIFNGTLVYL